MRGFVRLSIDELDKATPEFLRLLNAAINYRDELEEKAIQDAKDKNK